MSWVKLFFQLLWRLVVQAFLCLVDGGIAFVFVAAIFGFFAWLFGAASPRDVALTAGAIIGGLWSTGTFLMSVGKFIAAIREELQKPQYEKNYKSSV